MKGPEQFKRVSNMVKTLKSVAESCEGLDDMVYEYDNCIFKFKQ